MINKNNKTINEWYFNDSELIKVYKNGAICYYKMVLGETPHQEPCFAVVDNIQSYSDTEFVDVYDRATDKWYKLNNLDQYEEYGIYGDGRNITYYEGKLTIDNGYEYEWDGSEWNNLGEVTGSTATLPDVPFMVNYNAKEYDATNRKLPKTDGQSRNSDAVCNFGYHIVDHSADGYITVTGDTRMIISGTPYMNRTNTQTGCTMTIVSKVKTTNANNSYSILTNRGSYSTMNWMWRYPSNGIFLHGSSAYNNPKYLVSTTGQPITASIRISYNGGVKQQLNDWTNNGSYSGDFQYGSDYNGNNAMFCDYATESAEFWKGDFYWVYMSFNVLTDEQIQQVIAYNEGNTVPDYPKYYTEKDEPENNVVFTDMEDALAYQCPWVGMDVTIDNTPYLFGDAYEWLTKYGLFEVSGEYICDSGDKYEKMEEMVRNTDGTWSHQTPIVYEKGDLIEAGSPDCALPYDAEVQYLEADGTQYINTGVYLNTSNFEIGYSVVGKCGQFGYVHQNVANGAWVTVDCDNAFFGQWYQNNRIAISSYLSSTENTIKYTNSGVNVNGSNFSKNLALTGTDNLNSYPLVFFTHYDFYSRGLQWEVNSKFKSFYLKNNGTLVVDMIPVRKDGVGYMYDRVSGQLFANAGTGDFIIGPDVQ